MESSKYIKSDWIFQKVDVPDLSGEARQKTPSGLLDVRVTMAGRQIKAVFLGGDFFAEESAISDIEGSLRWHSSDSKKIIGTLENLYKKRKEELAFLPIENVYEVIIKAVESGLIVGICTGDAFTSRMYGCSFSLFFAGMKSTPTISPSTDSVSYTHLTLPTKRIV